jgi:hypothetical protein
MRDLVAVYLVLLGYSTSVLSPFNAAKAIFALNASLIYPGYLYQKWRAESAARATSWPATAHPSQKLEPSGVIL